MLIRDTHLTPALARWLRESHDDGEPELVIHCRQEWPDYRTMIADIFRRDGSEPSDTERTEITARLAAHAVEPLT